MNFFRSKWDKWETLTIGFINAQYFLLQARKHKNGKVQFRVEKSSEIYGSNIEAAAENFAKKIK